MLYSVATAGNAAPVELNSASNRTYQIATVEISPGSAHVVYTQRVDTFNTFLVDIYSSPIGGPGTSAVKLNQSGHSSVFGAPPAIAPNSQRVAIIDGGVWTMDLGGTSRAQLSQPGAIRGVTISPDSTRVAFGLENGSTMRAEYYVAPLSGPLSAGVQVMSLPPFSLNNVWFSSDSTRVLAQVSSTLYSAPSQGPASAAIEIATSPTEHFAYRSGNYALFQDARSYLASVPITGPPWTAQRLSIGTYPRPVIGPAGS